MLLDTLLRMSLFLESEGFGWVRQQPTVCCKNSCLLVGKLPGAFTAALNTYWQCSGSLRTCCHPVLLYFG